jgi:hypothetical protein
MIGVSIEKRLKWRDLSAVCLKNGHCVLLNRPTIFCGLTYNFLAFPQAIAIPLPCANFLLELDIRLWGAAWKITLMHSVMEIVRASIAKSYNK